MNVNIQPIEIIEKNKRVNLLGFTVFFSCWQIGQIATFNFKPLMSQPVYLFFSILLLIGSLGWVGFSYRLFKSNKLMKQHPELCKQLNDERANQLKNRAMSYGFLAAIASSAIFFVITFLTNELSGIDMSAFNGAFVSHSILVISIVSSWIAFLILDKE